MARPAGGAGNLQRRYRRAYAILALVFLAAVIAVTVALLARTRAVREADELWEPGQIAARELLTAVNDQETGQRGFILTGDETFLAPYLSGRTEADRAFDALHEIFGGEAEVVARIEVVRSSLADWQRQAAEPRISKARVDLGAAQDSVAEGSAKRLLEVVRADHADLVATIDRGSERAEAASNRSFLALLATTLVAGFLLLGAASWVLSRTRAWAAERDELLDIERQLRLDNAAAAERLEQAATLFRAVIGAAPVGVAVFDREMRFVHINETLAMRNGRSIADHIGCTVADILPPPSADRFVAMLHRAAAGDAITQMPITSDRGNASEKRHSLLSIFPVRAPDGALLAIGATVVDVTEPTRVAAELGEATALLDTLIEESPIGLAYFDLDGCYRRINRSLADLNGVPADATIGRTIFEVVPDLAPTLDRMFADVVATRTAVRDVEVIGTTQAMPGVQRHWLEGFYPVKNPGGELLGVGVAALEITDLRRSEQRLRHIASRLQASLLPTEVPDADGFEFSVRYRAAGIDMDVGGDFYDIAQRADGSYSIFIGDVCGHDIEAAVVTGLVRHTMTAAAQHLADPAVVLRWANQAVLDNADDGRFVTAVHARLEAAPGNAPAQLHLALAGHPHPIMIPASGAPSTEIGTTGQLLGFSRDSRSVTTTVEIAPGDTVVMYTDGLSENAVPRLTADELMALVTRSVVDSADATIDNILRRYDDLRLRTALDDVAVLVIRRKVVAIRALAPRPLAAPLRRSATV